MKDVIPVPSSRISNASALISAEDMAVLLQVHKATIWTWNASGKIPKPVKIGGTTRWVTTEIEHWIKAGCPPREKWLLLKK